MRKVKAVISRRTWRAVLLVAAAVLGVAVIAGCGPSAPSTTQAHRLEHQYPSLEKLGLSYVEWLIQTYGPDLVALLAAGLAL